MVPSLAARSNQHGISESNTASQLAETIVTEGIPKNIPKIKLIEKTASNKQKHFSFLTQIEIILWTKCN